MCPKNVDFFYWLQSGPCVPSSDGPELQTQSGKMNLMSSISLQASIIITDDTFCIYKKTSYLRCTSKEGIKLQLEWSLVLIIHINALWLSYVRTTISFSAEMLHGQLILWTHNKVRQELLMLGCVRKRIFSFSRLETKETTI